MLISYGIQVKGEQTSIFWVDVVFWVHKQSNPLLIPNMRREFMV